MLDSQGYTLYPIRKVTQTKFGFPEGNCLAACIASVLRMDDAEIELGLPSLCADGGVGDERAAAWLDSLGYAIRVITFGAPDESSLLNIDWFRRLAPSIVIAGGGSPRAPGDPDRGHAVVWKIGTGMIWDPHPSREGIIGPPTAVTLLVPTAFYRAEHAYLKIGAP